MGEWLASTGTPGSRPTPSRTKSVASAARFECGRERDEEPGPPATDNARTAISRPTRWSRRPAPPCPHLRETCGTRVVAPDPHEVRKRTMEQGRRQRLERRGATRCDDHQGYSYAKAPESMTSVFAMSPASFLRGVLNAL